MGVIMRGYTFIKLLGFKLHTSKHSVVLPTLSTFKKGVKGMKKITQKKTITIIQYLVFFKFDIRFNWDISESTMKRVNAMKRVSDWFRNLKKKFFKILITKRKITVD